MKMRLMAKATTIAPATPSRYSANSVTPCRLKGPSERRGMNAPISNVYTGSRAEQVMSGAIMMVVSRSRAAGMVRVAMMPGMAQAKLDSSGMKARPDSPTLPISRSSRKAARGR